MHSLGGTASSLAGAGEVVARVCGAADAAAVRETAARLDAELAGLPRGFGHGDFFAGNLLVDGGRLAGVVDWDGAGPGRLPLLDLLHLLVTSRWRGADLAWGPAIIGDLLPWVRAVATGSPATTAGGSASTRSRRCSSGWPWPTGSTGPAPSSAPTRSTGRTGEWIEANVGGGGARDPGVGSWTT